MLCGPGGAVGRIRRWPPRFPRPAVMSCLTVTPRAWVPTLSDSQRFTAWGGPPRRASPRAPRRSRTRQADHTLAPDSSSEDSNLSAVQGAVRCYSKMQEPRSGVLYTLHCSDEAAASSRAGDIAVTHDKNSSSSWRPQESVLTENYRGGIKIQYSWGARHSLIHTTTGNQDGW